MSHHDRGSQALCGSAVPLGVVGGGGDAAPVRAHVREECVRAELVESLSSPAVSLPRAEDTYGART